MIMYLPVVVCTSSYTETIDPQYRASTLTLYNTVGSGKNSNRNQAWLTFIYVAIDHTVNYLPRLGIVTEGVSV